MSNWNGSRASKLAGGGLYNGYSTPKAKQVWTLGATVNVGFVKNLTVTAIENGVFRLLQTNTGKLYEFAPHNGLYAV